MVWRQRVCLSICTCFYPLRGTVFPLESLLWHLFIKLVFICKLGFFDVCGKQIRYLILMLRSQGAVKDTSGEGEGEDRGWLRGWLDDMSSLEGPLAFFLHSNFFLFQCKKKEFSLYLESQLLFLINLPSSRILNSLLHHLPSFIHTFICIRYICLGKALSLMLKGTYQNVLSIKGQ